MAHTQFASMRSLLPVLTVAAVSGGSLTGSGTVNITYQGRNRAGWNLPRALAPVSYTAGQRIAITIPSTARAAGEDIHEYVISISTNGLLTGIRQVAIYQGYDTDQLTPRSLPATIYLSRDAHVAVGAGQTVANLAALPTGTNLINGMVREVTDIAKILEYRAESAATVDNINVFSATAGRWHRIYGFSTYIANTTDAGGCDRALELIDPTKVLQPPPYSADGSLHTRVRYWFIGSRDSAGPITAQGQRIGFRFFDDGVERTQGFDGLFQQTFNGYVSLADGTLDTSGMTTGSQVPYQFGKAGAYVLEKDLPAAQAAEFSIAPQFTLAQVSDLDQNSVISARLRLFGQSGDYNPLYLLSGNLITPTGNRLRVVPNTGLSVTVLDGAGTAGQFVFPVQGSTVATGLSSNTANQYIHIAGSTGSSYKGNGTPGTQEAIRAKVSTASGRSDPSAWTSYDAVSAGDTLSVTVTHGRDVRSDYPELSGATSVIAGSSLGEFNPAQVVVYVQRQSDGQIREFTFTPTDTATQVVSVTSWASGTIIGSLPTAPSPQFSLYEPTGAVFTSPSGSSDLTATNYRVAAAYVYDGGQVTQIQHEPESSNWMYESDRTQAELLSSSGTGGAINYTFAGTSGTPSAAEVRFNNATYSSVTQVLISETARDGRNVAGIVGNLEADARIIIGNRYDSNAHVIYKVTGNTDSGSYRTLTVEHESSNGTLDRDVVVAFVFAGTPGDDGLAATITIGTVTTGAPGSNVIVTNVGTPSAAVFDITIPAGDDGATGSVSAASALVLNEQGAIGTTGSGEIALTNVNNDLQWRQESNGPTYTVAATDRGQTYTKPQTVAPATLTDGSTITPDFSLTNVFRVTLGGNRTLAAPTNTTDGQTIIFIIKQDGTGSRTLAWNGVYTFPGGTDPTLSTGANAVDVVSCVVDGGSLRCVAGVNFS